MSEPTKIPDDRPRCEHLVVYPMSEGGCPRCLYARIAALEAERTSLLERIGILEALVPIPAITPETPGGVGLPSEATGRKLEVVGKAW